MSCYNIGMEWFKPLDSCHILTLPSFYANLPTWAAQTVVYCHGAPSSPAAGVSAVIIFQALNLSSEL